MYALVTPAQNEETYLPFVIDQMRQQRSEPSQWVIVDDGSEDRTPDIIAEWSAEVPWIEGITLDGDNEYDAEFGYARVVAAGIDHLDAQDVSAEYVGILDCDNLVRNDYFSALISAMRDESNCGVASGLVHSPRRRDTAEDVFPGSAMLLDRDCLADIGGYPMTSSPDSVLRLKAENRGWRTLKTDESYAVELRSAQSARGLWDGYKRQGEGRYFLDYHPVNAALTGLYHTTNVPYYPGLAYLYGYFGSLLRGDDRTDDAEVRSHYRDERFRNLRRRAVRSATAGLLSTLRSD